MDIMIYEDQTGEMQYPDIRTEKDSKIVSFFNNNIDLYIEKMGDNLVIYCHLIAFKASTRPTGYYIIYKDIYSDTIFTNFKKEINKVLLNLGLQPKSGHQDNIIFENIEKFDDRFQYYKEDKDIVIEAIKYGRNLEYSAGDIKEISSFCKDVLIITNNIKISISSTKNNLGNINILINKKRSEALKRTDSTEQIISEQRERLREKKKIEEGGPGLIKIKDGFDRIREGVDVLKNAGYNNLEVRNEIDKKLKDIYVGIPTYTERYEPEKKEEKADDKKEGIVTKRPETAEDNVEIDKVTTKSHVKTLVAIIGIITIIAAIIVVAIYPQVLPEGITNIIKPTPTETPTTEPEILPTLTSVETPAPIDENNNTDNQTNNTDNQTNGTNSIIDVTTKLSNKTNGTVVTSTPVSSPTSPLPTTTSDVLLP